jgi:hypothetical protein
MAIQTAAFGGMPRRWFLSLSDTMATINHLFPPEQINNLPSWRFVLHFKAPKEHREAQTVCATGKLKSLQMKVVTFPSGVDSLPYETGTDTVAIILEVPEACRKKAGSLADYESDFWKIFAAMLDCGFGDVYYEAIDWRE